MPHLPLPSPLPQKPPCPIPAAPGPQPGRHSSEDLPTSLSLAQVRCWQVYAGHRTGQRTGERCLPLIVGRGRDGPSFGFPAWFPDWGYDGLSD